ncbi:unnamed protein product [Plutella xylostella]|uniref:(diamondback moth) hypothetical protein n=1 Tax=Plutella xylostella TaxID=51655 RepID=A0A8S4F4A3_PLUXY|nr:unnamed protein product [Plutella xylostella]
MDYSDKHSCLHDDISPNIKRSKSMQSLRTADMEALSTALEKFHYENEAAPYRSRLSESSIEISIINDSDTSRSSDSDMDTCMGGKDLRGTEDSGICDRGCSRDADALHALEVKVDKLTELFLEQNEQLSALKEEVRSSGQTTERALGRHGQVALDVVHYALAQRLEALHLGPSDEATQAGAAAAGGTTSRAQALLDALEFRQKTSNLDAVIKTALTEFLQSDALKEQMVSATTSAIKSVINSCFSKDVTAAYLPLLERSHRRLLGQVSRTLDDAFKEIESNAASFSRSSYKSAKSIRIALERHQRLLEQSSHANIHSILKKSVHEALENELSKWRQKTEEVLSDTGSKQSGSEPGTTCLKYIPVSPPQPTEPGRSAIELMMNAAEINEQIKEGDINGSFEKALLASDLSLVMAACRAADPATVFSAACQLQQNVLLSLIQQLATDMVHDTQLKCRYLEDSIMKLDTHHPVTKSHLPVVVAEVSKNLNAFLHTFPSHMSSRRIKMIIMAAKSLLKESACTKQ